MSPKPLAPDDEIECVSAGGIRKKKGRSGNSKKRTDYFLQQRFPFLPSMVEEEPEEKIKDKDAVSRISRGITAGEKKKPKITPEEYQAMAAPLAATRMEIMREYQRRLLAQQYKREQEEAKKALGDPEDQEQIKRRS